MDSVRRLRLILLSAAYLVAGASVASAFPSAPPKSDGSSGSFDAQFGNGYSLVWFDTDTGEVYYYVGGGVTTDFNVPHKSIQYNGQTVNAYEFTDLNMESTVSLKIIGGTPAVFLAQGNINIAGQFVFANDSIAGGTPSTGNPGQYDGGPGGGKGGGGGGTGPGGGDQACVSDAFTGSGGGGGGNYSKGGPGRPNYVPIDAGNQVHYAGGAAGKKENSAVLQGGGGGGAPGGGNDNGEYWQGAFGGNGGGAVVFSTPGTITITSTGLISATGAIGNVPNAGNAGNSGGGAGGDTWFFARGGVSNSGQIVANGAVGGRSKFPVSTCGSQKLTAGPDGGDGSGGVVLISAPTIANSGTINVAGGNGKSTPNGGLVTTNGTTISNTGMIVGSN
jgi:hypothetical protein